MRLQVIDSKEFHSLILEDASSVRDRHETDSIPVVDDIRFHLYRGILPNSTSDEDEELIVDGESKLQMLQSLLEHLGIDG